MTRRHLVIVGGVFSALLLLYCLGFGPLVYLWIKAEQHGLMPDRLDDALEVVFHPHMVVMYHAESYFDYVMWFIRQAETTPSSDFHWEEFRRNNAERFE